MSYKSYLLESDELRTKQAKTLGLSHIGYNYYENKQGIIFTYDKKSNKFIRSNQNNPDREIEKKKDYSEIFKELSEDSKNYKLMLILSSNLKIYQDTNKPFEISKEEKDLLKKIEEFMIDKSEYSGKQIFRGMNFSSVQKDYQKHVNYFKSLLNKEFKYKPREGFSSWTVDKTVALSFYRTYNDNFLLEGKLKKTNKFIDVIMFTKFFDKFNKHITKQGKGIKMEFDRNFLEEKEIIIFGNVEAKVVEFKPAQSRDKIESDETPYGIGYKAAKSNLSHESNPHPKNSVKYLEYQVGWNDFFENDINSVSDSEIDKLLGK